MKQWYFFIPIFIILGMLLNSCESFLNTTATDSYNEANWWKTESQAISSLNGCYKTLMNPQLGGTVKLQEENLSPNSYNMSGDAVLQMGIHTSANDKRFESKWNACYEGIGRCNNFLMNIDRPDMDADIRARAIGEVKFLRAYYYSRLINYFGGVPLILDSPDLSQSSLPRNSREEVLTQIFKDLDDAVAILPISYSGADIGRATKGAALALKARVNLYEGKWNETAEVAKEVIDLGVYNLFSDYRGLFLPENENNSEVIFDVQYLIPEYYNIFDIILILQQNLAPTLDLANCYLCTDGKTTVESTVYDSANPYDNRDPRLHKTIVVPNYMFRGSLASRTKYYSSGFAFKKYSSYSDNEYVEDINKSEINFILLRYADVLLMYAEAKNEMNDVDASVYNALNSIRARAGMPDFPEDLGQDSLRKLIRLERRVELAGESLYYDDIRRWKTAEITNNGSVYNYEGEILQTRSFNANRDYLWPIHSNVIQENPNLEQNPNY